MKEKLSQAKIWVQEAGDIIRKKLKYSVTVTQKTNRSDLVTNVDKEIEAFIVQKIRTAFPQDKIVGEEGLGDDNVTQSDNVWYVDPIDGTLNFVTQRKNFCVMLAYYESGIGKFGIIYDVIGQQFVWGATGLGVFLNDSQISGSSLPLLADGLVGVNAYMYAENVCHVRDIAKQSLGVRVMGCAGIEFIELLQGNIAGYLSNLSPWDYAAGAVLCDVLGLVVIHADGSTLSFSGRKPVFAISQATLSIIQPYLQG